MFWARIPADLAVVLDARYVALVVLGMAAILIGVALGREFLGTHCPFTAWENAPRARAGRATYPGAFFDFRAC